MPSRGPAAAAGPIRVNEEPRLDILASFLGGLGLFLAGVHGLGVQVQQMAGRRLRVAVAHATRGGLSAALSGAALGALTQSSSAVTVISASLVQAGTLPLRGAIPVVAWCNIGTAVLVLLAALDLRVAALWLLGTTGCALAFAPGGGRWKSVLGAVFQLGLIFLGLALLKAGAAPLGDSAAVRAALLQAGHGLAIPFALGAAMTMVAQSSSVVTVLAIALANVGLLDGAQAGMAVCGASLGSGLSVLLVGNGLRGAARRLATFQVLFKVAGAALLALPFLLRHLLPDLPAPLSEIGLPQRLSLLFVALQLLPALLVTPFHRFMPALLERLSPATAEEALSLPEYLYDGALEDVPTALDLVAREGARLLGRLPGLLDDVREEGVGSPLPREALSAASAAVERSVGTFLQEILGRGCPREELERALAFENLNGLVSALRETVAEQAGVLEAIARRGADDPLGGLVGPLAESLHLLLTELHEAALSGDAESAATLSELSADRSVMMDGIRRRLARAGVAMQDGLDLLFRATSLFERAVWLIRRSALLLPRTGEERVSEAVPAGEDTMPLAAE